MNIAVITGASSGIGAALVRRIAAEQYRYGGGQLDQVFVLARRTERLRAMADELGPDRIRVFGVDLTDESAIASFGAVLAQESPTIRLLVNCAGMGSHGYFRDVPPSVSSATIRLNVLALTSVTSLCLPYMSVSAAKGDRSTFHIVNIGSTAGFLPQPGFSVYAAGKAYVISFSRALAAELIRDGIRVTCACPGPIDTEFFAVGDGAEKGEPRGLKKLVTGDPTRFAKAALRASEKGRRLFVYGLSQKCLHLLAHILPARFMIFLGTKFTGN